MIERWLMGALFGLLVGGVATVFGAFVAKLVLDKWLARTTEVKRAIFKVRHNDGIDLALKFGCAVAFIALGIYALEAEEWAAACAELIGPAE
jgi:hypothetical protein